jgi:N-acetylglutamate synthase-like GNAT family acetyltransferase
MVVLALHRSYSQVFGLSLFLSLLILQANQYTLGALTNFWVAECDGKVIGCVKLFCYHTHSEAYLVCVDSAWRGQEVGSHLVQRLTDEATLPLYLASQPHRLQFYTRLSFVPLPPDAVPMMMRNCLGIDRFYGYGIVAMVFR